MPVRATGCLRSSSIFFSPSKAAWFPASICRIILYSAAGGAVILLGHRLVGQLQVHPDGLGLERFLVHVGDLLLVLGLRELRLGHLGHPPSPSGTPAQCSSCSRSAASRSAASRAWSSPCRTGPAVLPRRRSRLRSAWPPWRTSVPGRRRDGRGRAAAARPPDIRRRGARAERSAWPQGRRSELPPGRLSPLRRARPSSSVLAGAAVGVTAGGSVFHGISWARAGRRGRAGVKHQQARCRKPTHVPPPVPDPVRPPPAKRRTSESILGHFRPATIANFFCDARASTAAKAV